MSGKKAFDREKMYRKIMPSYADNDVDVDLEESESKPTVELENLANNSDEAFKINSEIMELNAKDSKYILANLTEKIMFSKLEMVLDNMGCCKCSRCKMDIIACAMNQLPPRYVVDTPGAVDARIETCDVNREITSVLLKSALTVRKNPRHD